MAEIKMKKSNQKAVQMPGKKTMNFVHHQSSFNLKKVLPVLVIILAIGAVFAKFGFMDPLAEKTAAYKELAQKQEQLAAINAKLTGYEELVKEYGRYSYGWMDETEVNMVSRMDVLHLVEEEISSKAYIDNLAVNNNVLTLNIHGITLEQASAMVKSLEERGLVESAAVYNAVAEQAEEAKIFMSIILTKEAE
jgi:cell division protein FtsB